MEALGTRVNCKRKWQQLHTANFLHYFASQSCSISATARVSFACSQLADMARGDDNPSKKGWSKRHRISDESLPGTEHLSDIIEVTASHIKPSPRASSRDDDLEAILPCDFCIQIFHQALPGWDHEVPMLVLACLAGESVLLLGSDASAGQAVANKVCNLLGVPSGAPGDETARAPAVTSPELGEQCMTSCQHCHNHHAFAMP